VDLHLTLAAQLGYSPDRVDALVWALTELMLGETCQGWVDFYEDTHPTQRASSTPRQSM
jgi:hypothetical protein